MHHERRQHVLMFTRGRSAKGFEKSWISKPRIFGSFRLRRICWSYDFIFAEQKWSKHKSAESSFFEK
jgi:hypothetical protein